MPRAVLWGSTRNTEALPAFDLQGRNPIYTPPPASGESAWGHQVGRAAKVGFRQLTVPALWPNKGLAFQAVSDLSTLTYVFTQQLQLALPQGQLDHFYQRE